MEGDRSQSIYAPGSFQFGNTPLPKATLVSGPLLRRQPQQKLLLPRRAGSPALPLQTCSGANGSTRLLHRGASITFPVAAPVMTTKLGVFQQQKLILSVSEASLKSRCQQDDRPEALGEIPFFAFLSFWGLEAPSHQSLPPSLHGLLLFSLRYLLLSLSYKGICEGI